MDRVICVRRLGGTPSEALLRHGWTARDRWYSDVVDAQSEICPLTLLGLELEFCFLYFFCVSDRLFDSNTLCYSCRTALFDSLTTLSLSVFLRCLLLNALFFKGLLMILDYSSWLH